MEDKWVAQTLDRVLGQKATGGFGVLESPDEWWARRAEWAVGGSASGGRAPVAHQVYPDAAKRPEWAQNASITKRSLVETLPGSYWEQLLKAEPRVRSRPHTKLNETSGKLRAIYGVDTEHYFVSSYPGQVWQRVLGRGLDLGLSPIQACSREVKLLEAASTGAGLLSFDYAGYNEQHSLGRLREVHLALARHARDNAPRGPGKDWLLACQDWLAQAVTKQMVHYPGKEKPTQVQRGLLSGVRDTTLSNTLLNLVYCEWVDRQLRRHLPEAPRNRWCHGDDMVAVTSDSWASLAWVETARESGFRASSHKCLATGRRCEYLRLSYTREGVVGQLARSVSSWVNGNWDQPLDRDPARRATQILGQAEVLASRGACPQAVGQLAADGIRYWVAKRAVKGEEGLLADALKTAKRTPCLKEAIRDLEQLAMRPLPVDPQRTKGEAEQAAAIPDLARRARRAKLTKASGDLGAHMLAKARLGADGGGILSPDQLQTALAQSTLGTEIRGSAAAGPRRVATGELAPSGLARAWAHPPPEPLEAVRARAAQASLAGVQDRYDRVLGLLAASAKPGVTRATLRSLALTICGRGGGHEEATPIAAEPLDHRPGNTRERFIGLATPGVTVGC